MIRLPEGYLLFKVLKDNIDYKKYNSTCRYNEFESTRENEFGIKVSEEQVSDKRDLKSGRYIGRIVHITCNYNASRDRNGILLGELFIQEIRDKLSVLNNRVYHLKELEIEREIDKHKYKDLDAIITDKENSTVSVNISQVDLFNGVGYQGKSKMDIPQYSIRLTIYYTINYKEE